MGDFVAVVVVVVVVDVVVCAGLVVGMEFKSGGIASTNSTLVLSTRWITREHFELFRWSKAELEPLLSVFFITTQSSFSSSI